MQNISVDNQKNENKKYEIHIDNFDGPLDVLWDLIKRSKIDITEISISDITEQYLEFLSVMKTLNVRIAIDFIRMASELLFYKSKALLPSGEIEEEYFVPPLPPELIEKLLEYKKFQKSAAALSQLYERRSRVYNKISTYEFLEEHEEYYEVSLFDLLKAFANVLESRTSIEEDEIIFDEILISDRIEYITELLRINEVILFTDIIRPDSGRPEILTSFLAMLEMTKTHLIKIVQHRVFGDIRLVRIFSITELS